VAHKGKFYEVWFRRDFGVNQPNYLAYARTYKVQVGPFAIPCVPTGFFFVFTAVNDQRDAGDTREWTFEPVAKCGIQWAGSMKVTNDPIDGWLDTFIALSTDVHLFTWAGLFKLAEKQFDYEHMGNAGLVRIDLQTDICQTAGLDAIVNANAQGYGP